MGGRLYLEDLHVGQRFESATLALTADEIKAFARQFDPQPFHLDEDDIGASVEVRWPCPVRPGDELKVVSEVIRSRPRAPSPTAASPF